jgi:hypothetical protein
MNASKYPLEICGCPLPFLYLTLTQISIYWLLLAVKTELTTLFDVAGLSVAIHYGASKSDTPTHNLVTTIESSCDGFLSRLRFRAEFWTKIVVLADFPSLWTPSENRQLYLTQPHRWGRLLFHCPKNLSGHPLVRNLANLSFWPSLSMVGCR